MSKLFATGLARPVLREGYPLTLAIAIREQVGQTLYFERVYYSATGSQLAIRATAILGRGVLLLTEAGPLPVGTTRMEASVTNINRATEADPVLPVMEPVSAITRFATDMHMPVLHEGKAVSLHVHMSNTYQPVFLEREYLDHARQTLGIRSDIVYDRLQLVGFQVHEPPPLPGTRYINVCLTNQDRSSGELNSLKEYTQQEHNTAEYN